MKNIFYFVGLMILLGLSLWLHKALSLQEEARINTEGEAVSAVATTSPIFFPQAKKEAGARKFAALGVSYEIGEVTIVLTDLIEDSRCPSDVTCIQAGTVRVRGLISTAKESNERTFVLGEPQITASGKLTLVDARPLSRSDVSIQKDDYEFYFEIVD